MNFLLLAPAVFFLANLFFIPLAYLVFLGVQGFSTSIFQDDYLLYVIQFTYWQAFLSALLSVGLGFVFAFLIKEWTVFGGRLLWQFGLLCSSLPSIIVALGILGSLNEKIVVFGWRGILWGHVFLNVAIPLRLIGNALTERERTSELAAQALGCPRWVLFWRFTFYSIRGSVISSWLLTFLYSSTSLFVVLFLGGGPRFTTLEVALYEAIKLNLDNSRAIQIGLFQAVVGAILFFFYLKLQKKTKLEGERLWVPIYAPRNTWLKGLGTLALWAVIGWVFVGPLAAIFREGIASWSFLGGADLAQATLTSLGIASAVVCLSILLLYPYLHCLHQRASGVEGSGWTWAVAFPQFFSSLVISLALSVFYPFVREVPWLSYLAIICTQTLFVIPLIQFPLREGFLRLSRERNWIAQSLGASSWQRWFWVELPFMKRSLFLSVLIGFGFSLGEVVSLLLFSPPGVKTLALNVFQAMSRYRFQEARATTLILLITMLVLFGVAGYLEDRDESSSR